MALMGPSGSGKTTLLNVLAHRDPATKIEVSGGITVNGSAVSRHAFQSISSYVEQEDALIGSLTVRETLDFAARLSLPRSVMIPTLWQLACTTHGYLWWLPPLSHAASIPGFSSPRTSILTLQKDSDKQRTQATCGPTTFCVWTAEPGR